jgi:hypothetical protein
MNEFVITAVHMNPDRSGIASVRGQTPGMFGHEVVEQTKFDVIVRINTLIWEYRTYKEDNGQEVVGPVVRVVNGRFGTYIRSDADNTEADNLGELPEY